MIWELQRSISTFLNVNLSAGAGDDEDGWCMMMMVSVFWDVDYTDNDYDANVHNIVWRSCRLKAGKAVQ